MSDELTRQPIVRDRHQTLPVECPFGHVQRVVTGGEGGIANVHVVAVTEGKPHRHEAYDEVYYFLSGRGSITLDEQTHRVLPGTVVVIPAGVVHSLAADEGQELEFVIFGTPPVPLDDDRARPRRP